MVTGTQGMGAFERPREEVHNEVFQDMQLTSFEDYFRGGLGVWWKGR